ncbi:hypothetical protein [Formosa algae]|uniref:Outer membrane protein beta-barrel domain-containing protein n=1 Tax=Formosa algae TaxID=225843 RepID=A0A9X0YIL1_9FLAO|nr:hypothetical protein [Formosa algae]MBP1839095.1 hypothetical protein [Formosa algae]MDQ0333872.1 hypothetical protein [Formosa algae]OEI80931.1 hypothetical protein AST99_06885 [Formosa algae]
MKKITVILFFLMCSTFAYSQFRGYDEWVASAGINIVDNSAFKDPLKGTEDWSFSTPITIGIEYKFDEYWSLSSMISLNKIDKFYVDYGQSQETGLAQGWLNESGTYFSFDVNGKFYYDELIARNDQIDAYAGLGLGYFNVSDESNVSGNFALGLRFWFTPEYGVRLQSMAKFAFDNDKVYANNNFIHSLEFLYRF